MNFSSIGSDPEFVLRDASGALRSALEVFAQPTELGGMGEIFADNVLAELNIMPGSSAGELQDNFHAVLRMAAKAVHPYRLSAESSVMFPESEMTHPMAKQFGCNPEYDAWQSEGDQFHQCQAPSPKDSLRTCGGHIHVGVSTEVDVIPIVRLMDLFVGITSVVMCNDPSAQRRHQMYGGAGRFRVTSYGFEYRMPSNFWLSNPQAMTVIASMTDLAVSMDSVYIPADVILAINNFDKTAAKRIFDSHIAKRITNRTKTMITQLANAPHGSLYTNWGV